MSKLIFRAYGMMLLLSGVTLGGQPLLRHEDQLWAVAEVSEPEDQDFTILGVVKYGIQMDAETRLRFSLPTPRSDTAYLVFSRSVSEMKLTDVSGRAVVNGDDFYPSQTSWPRSNRVLPIPPDWLGPFELKLYPANYRRYRRRSKPLEIQYLQSGFEAHYSKYLDAGRSRPFRSGNLVFLSVLGALLLLAFLGWTATRQGVFGAYLLYNGWVFLYYLLRKGPGIGLVDWWIPDWLYTCFEAVGSVIITGTYLFFLRRFLADVKVEGSPLVLRQLARMLKGSFIVIGLISFILSAGCIWIGYLFSTACNILLLAWGSLLLLRIHRLQDTKARIVIRAALVLVIGIGMLFFRWLLLLKWPDLPDVTFLGMSLFQLAVLLESIVLLYGVLVWIRKIQVAFYGKQEGDGAQVQGEVEAQGVPPPAQLPPLEIGHNLISQRNLLYLRTKKDRFFAGYRTGEVAFNGRLTNWNLTGLPQHPNLVRVDRSHIVNLHEVRLYESNGSHSVHFHDSDEVLHVSRKHREAFTKKYTQWG